MPLDRFRETWKQADSWVKAAVILWAAVVLITGARAVLRPRAHTVYGIFALAARHWVDGADLYADKDEPFRYSPLVASFFVPFGFLPDGLGGMAWRLVNGAVFLGALAWWSKSLLPANLTARHRALLFLLILPLAIGNLNNGQSNTLIIGLILAATAAARGDRWNLAGVCLAVACLFKIYPIVIALLLSAVFPRRFAGRFLVALLIGLAAPFVLQHPGYVWDQYHGWLAHVGSNDRQILPRGEWYRDLRLLVSVWVKPISYRDYMVLQVLSGGAIAMICLAVNKVRANRQQTLHLVFALGCCWMTICGPSTESATYILLAPAAAWAFQEAWLWRRPVWQRCVFLSSYGMLLLSQMANWFPFAKSFHSLGPQPLAGLLLMGGIAALVIPTLLRRQSRPIDTFVPVSARAA